MCIFNKKGMTDLQTKFFTACVAARGVVAIIVAMLSDKQMKMLTPIVVFLIIFGLYKYSTHTPEQVGAHNQLVWWNISRLIHTIMLIIFVYLVVYEKFNYAKMIPFIDILIGIAAVSYHYSSYK